MDKKLLVSKTIKVKAYEIDVMGIASNINYIKWFEDARHLFLDEYYPFEEMMKSGISPILKKTEIEYKTPVTIYDKPIIECWVTNLGKAKWQMSFEIKSDEIIHCIGNQIGCFYNLKTNRPTAVPEKLIEAYEK